MNNKNKIIAISFLISSFISTSCNGQQKCGVGKLYHSKVEFYICEEMLNIDTIKNDDNRWFAESEFVSMRNWVEYKNVPILDSPPIMEESWLGEFDTIAFHLPLDYKITEAKQSFVIIPSIWARDGDEVVQYKDFYELKEHCINPKVIKPTNNVLVNPLNINENLANELYFKNENEISKNELLLSLKKQFDSQETFLKEMVPDEYSSASDINKLILDNHIERKIYTKYLNNYTTWKNAPKEQFELLSVKRYLTLTIQNGENTKTLTFVYIPVYGN